MNNSIMNSTNAIAAIIIEAHCPEHVTHISCTATVEVNKVRTNRDHASLFCHTQNILTFETNDESSNDDVNAFWLGFGNCYMYLDRYESTKRMMEHDKMYVSPMPSATRIERNFQYVDVHFYPISINGVHAGCSTGSESQSVSSQSVPSMKTSNTERLLLQEQELRVNQSIEQVENILVICLVSLIVGLSLFTYICWRIVYKRNSDDDDLECKNKSKKPVWFNDRPSSVHDLDKEVYDNDNDSLAFSYRLDQLVDEFEQDVLLNAPFPELNLELSSSSASISDDADDTRPRGSSMEMSVISSCTTPNHDAICWMNNGGNNFPNKKIQKGGKLILNGSKLPTPRRLFEYKNDDNYDDHEACSTSMTTEAKVVTPENDLSENENMKSHSQLSNNREEICRDQVKIDLSNLPDYTSARILPRTGGDERNISRKQNVKDHPRDGFQGNSYELAENCEEKRTILDKTDEKLEERYEASNPSRSFRPQSWSVADNEGLPKGSKRIVKPKENKVSKICNPDKTFLDSFWE